MWHNETKRRWFLFMVSRILIQQQQQPRTSQLWYWLYMWWCSWLLLSLIVFLCTVLVLTSKQNTVSLSLFIWLSVPLPLFLFLCFCFRSSGFVSVPLPLFCLFYLCFGSFAMGKSFVWQSDFPMVEAGVQRNGATERKKSEGEGPKTAVKCMWFKEIERLSWNKVFYPHWKL